ncbi:MAG TPA: hypothetical protein VGL13_00700, partial [Polyangiaceae bacterium]
MRLKNRLSGSCRIGELTLLVLNIGMRTAERCCARGILWSRASGLALSTLVLAACGGSNSGDDVCLPDDADGVVGGPAAFDLTVDDTGFTPTILTAQNLANVTLTLHNTGTKSHGFAVDCMPTPNDNGCPITSCFPDDTTIAAVDPGGMAV